jgi:putative integral membrane protein (TIGR02587 family)
VGKASVSKRTARGWSPDATTPERDPHGWRQERQDLLRALTGGALVGIPLLYTMEVWYEGLMLDARHLLLILACGFGINFLFNLISGFRHTYSVEEALSEAVTAIALGVLCSAGLLTLIGEADWVTRPQDSLGKTLIAGLGMSLGASFANSQVAGKSRCYGESTGARAPAALSPHQDQSPERRQLRADLADAGATVAGATVFALSIAPTEEVIVIATRLSAWQQLWLLAATVALCYVVLFASGFEEHHVFVESVLQNPIAETIMATALSLLVAFGLLVLIGPGDLMSDPATLAAGVVTLGLPAVVGGAAGRLIV